MATRSRHDTGDPILPKVQPKKLKQVLAVISVSLGTFCAGTVLSWTSPALSHIEIIPNITKSLPTSPGFVVNANEGALIASMLTIGALGAAIPIGYFADKIGRKPTILALAVMFLIHWCMICFANNLTVVVVARLFAGVGLGGICVVAPMYIGEIADAANRGLFGSFLQLFLSGGVLFTCLIGSFTSWLSLSLTLSIIPTILLITFALMPESPVFLLSKNKINRAKKNLQSLRGPSYDISEEINNIEYDIAQSRKNDVSIGDILTNKAHVRALISVVGVLACQQFCGINAIIFYTINIFTAAGTNISPFLSAVIIDLVQFVASFVCMMVTEKANRRFFLMISSAGMMVCLMGLGAFFHLKMILQDVTFLAFLPLASTILFMVFFCVGYGPVPWMLLGELFAPEIKGIASGIAILLNWICAFLVTFSFPILNATFGSHVTFYIFGSVMALATLFVYWVVPETRGKSLTQIQDELNR